MIPARAAAERSSNTAVGVSARFARGEPFSDRSQVEARSPRINFPGSVFSITLSGAITNCSSRVDGSRLEAKRGSLADELEAFAQEDGPAHGGRGDRDQFDASSPGDRHAGIK